MSASLVGSEMCIRDRSRGEPGRAGGEPRKAGGGRGEAGRAGESWGEAGNCLLYTSDAADDM
eukprot:6439327-Alexandrium_andersonii.AAC.1